MNKLLLVTGVAVTAVLILGCTIGRSKGPNLLVDAFGADEDCRIVVNGEHVDSQRLLKIASAWPSRRGIVRMGKDTPYKCVGGVVFTLQRAGFVRVRTMVRVRPD